MLFQTQDGFQGDYETVLAHEREREFVDAITSAAVQADELLKIMDGEIMDGEGDGGGWEA